MTFCLGGACPSDGNVLHCFSTTLLMPESVLIPSSILSVNEAADLGATMEIPFTHVSTKCQPQVQMS